MPTKEQSSHVTAAALSPEPNSTLPVYTASYRMHPTHIPRAVLVCFFRFPDCNISATRRTQRQHARPRSAPYIHHRLLGSQVLQPYPWSLCVPHPSFRFYCCPLPLYCLITQSPFLFRLHSYTLQKKEKGKKTKPKKTKQKKTKQKKARRRDKLRRAPFF
jgi:hypothetical protein